jgi:hypothetical protein
MLCKTNILCTQSIPQTVGLYYQLSWLTSQWKTYCSSLRNPVHPATSTPYGQNRIAAINTIPIRWQWAYTLTWEDTLRLSCRSALFPTKTITIPGLPCFWSSCRMGKKKKGALRSQLLFFPQRQAKFHYSKATKLQSFSQVDCLSMIIIW